ncbi:MAG: hypothetical protein KKG59_01020 [Nanoarchaeota archaeon]|nr:hypothetical protein [Nanoarchaeota archaeon]
MNNKADNKYLCVVAVSLPIDIKTNPNIVITGNATNNPAHLESKDLEMSVAPTTTAPDKTNVNII